MHITEEELKEYFELKNNFENNNLKLTEQDLILVNKVNSHVRTCPDCMNKYNGKENEKDEMETLTEEYGIDFKNIKHIRLQNGEEYYKLYDMRLNKDYLLEQENKSKNLSEEFKEIQKNIKEAQKYSGETNASEVFRYQLMHTNNGKKLYSVDEVENNPDLLANINQEQMKAISTLLKNKDKLQLISINVETGIAIDHNHEIIVAELNEKTHQYEINRPQEYQYDTKTINSNEMLEDMDLLDIDSYDIVITDDVPTIVNGENLDPARVKFFYEYPEALDKQTLSQKERLAYLIAVKKFQLIKEAKKREIEKVDNKKYVKTKRNLFNQTGFTNTILLSLLTGFAGGVITTIMYMIIK